MRYLIQFVIKLLALLPMRLNHLLGTGLGYLFYAFNTRLRRISEKNIQLCFPQWDTAKQQQLLKSSLIEMGKSVTEIAPVWSWKPEKLLELLTVTNEQLLDAAIQSQKGIIFLTPHLGCWEIAGLYVGQKLPVTSLYQEPKLSELGELVRNARERTGAQLVNTGRKGMISLLKSLKNGQSVAILPDQTPKSLNSGVFVPFFGNPALTMNLVSSLGNKSQAQIIIGFAKRKAQGKGYYLELMPGNQEMLDSDPVKAATAMNRQIEALIQMAPEQYQWSYKRFKKVPEGMEKVY